MAQVSQKGKYILWSLKMCFSALSSFTASALLVTSGVYCSKKVIEKNNYKYLPMAMIPLLFGLQQALEGMVWLSLDAHNPVLVNYYALGFLFFSHFLWPFQMAIAALKLETRKVFQRLFLGFAIVGLLYGSFLYFPLLINSHWLSVSILRGSIDYQIKVLSYQPWGPWLYMVLCLMPLILSENRKLRGLGWLILAALFLAKLIFYYAFISVWCFFAAIISTYVILELLPQKSQENLASL